MKKKIISLTLALIMLFMHTSIYAETISFDAKKSIVKVQYNASDYTKYKVIVSKGKSKYIYNLYDNSEVFALQMGSGTYTVKLYERISGNKYRPISTKSQNVKLTENTVYLQSIQNINWTDKSKAISLAKKLGLSKTTSEERFKEIHEEIIKNIIYDDYKASVVTNRYLPVIDETYLQKKGICYDYSALMASMLRSLGIPTKMIHGNSSKVAEYHAWNEVLLNGKWIVVDTTIDAQLFKYDMKYDYSKPTSEYVPSKEF